MTDSSILEFMLITGNLKKNKRTGWVLHDVPAPESIADHMYRMALFTMLLDDTVHSDGEPSGGPKLNKTRCMKIALVHDLCEAVVGDITPHCGVSVEEKHRREKEAMNEMCNCLKAEVTSEIMSLYEEYEKQDTREAKTVKDLDRFEMILQAYEYELNHTREEDSTYLEEFYISTAGKFQNVQVVQWVKELTRLRASFHSSLGIGNRADDDANKPGVIQPRYYSDS